MDSQLKQKTAKGLLWGSVGNGTLQLLNLFFGIFLSRLLSPSDYGTIGALTLFSAAAGLFADSGFVLAIVNKKKVDHDDYNAVFWFNLITGTFFYCLLFALAPLIARFYRQPEMAALSRFLFLSFFLGCISGAPTAYLFRNLMVKERSTIMIIAIIVSGCVGVACAYNGWGYWGLAVQTVLYSGVNSLLIWIRCPWRPGLRINFTPIREMFGFGVRQLMTSLFTHINNNVFALLLGRFYGMKQTGYYTQGNKWTTMGYSTLSGMTNSVGQPVLREASDDRVRLQRVFRKMLRFIAFLSFPAMLGLALVSKEVVVLAITDKWLPCVPVMQILCLWGAFMPITTLYGNLFNSQGLPRIYMWCTIALGLIQLACIVASYPFGLYTMLVVYTAVNILWLFVWQYYAHKHTGLRLIDVLRDIIPYFLAAASVMGATWLLTRGIDSMILSLALKIIIAIALYIFVMWISGSRIFRESLRYLFKKFS